MNLSLRRSEQYRNEIKNPYRENDFMVQRQLEASRKSGRSGDPGQFWLEQLLYLLETSHDDLLADAEKTGANAVAGTYKHVIERYTLQIWKAADGYEFFLNERLVDFEGDTQSFLGTEVKETGPQLVWMTTKDLIHLILPISPEVAVIFCDESRCWESPFADSMHRLKIPFPANSMLKNAPHKDIINVHVPSERRGKNRWPATMAWRVSIGTLSCDHHRILASYSLSHAESFVVVRRRARFERAKRELEVFSKERAEVWKSQGFRFGCTDTQRQLKEEDELSRPSQKQITRIVDDHVSAVAEVLNIIKTSDEPLRRTKHNAFKSWLTVCVLDSYRQNHTATPSSRLDTEPTHFDTIHPAVKAAFEAAYPPQHPDHKHLVTIGFGEFLDYGIGEETFAQLALKIELKISELVHANTFHTHWEAFTTNSQPPEEALLQNDEDLSKEPTLEEELLKKPSFRSMYRAAQGFSVLQWLFEERQDILATFIQQIAVPMEDMRPHVVRTRAKPE
ncbi:hypothetical protein PRK78_007054 [Emydomyces testavorans]|uniref:Uncharacterized protein n=1 Tax=Emydomyces testavorans TaxID=2070801 RepID=A0AAF0DNC7_9EURO|nr:hypothetical protein PRK78_007054 [Emydomyces testavorans]